MPGAATASVNGTSFTLGNAALSSTWSVGTNAVTLTASTVPMTVTNLFALTLANGTVITPANAPRTAGPTLSDLVADPAAGRLADRFAGKAVTSTFRYTSGTSVLEVDWTAELRDDANSVQHTFALRAVSGNFDISDLRFVDVSAGSARVVGSDDGSPVVFGPAGAETGFIGVENPMAKATVVGTTVRIGVPRASDLLQGQTWTYSASVGVSPAGQLRRSFQYYVARERVRSRRTFLHYQSWLDLKPPSETINAAALTSSINLFGSQLTSRGAKIDSFWVDDGWDYVRSPRVANETNLNVWDVDPTQYPTGLTPQRTAAAQYGGASLSVWMSPFGGYGTSASSRLALNASKPAAQQLETYSGSAFQLGGAKYGARFRQVAFNMIDNYGVRGFKFDGIGGGLFQSGPNATYRADYEALLDLTRDLRAHQKDVWINATVGTWGSPYWLWYTDSIYRDGTDSGQAGVGTGSQKYVNYRDSQTYRNNAVQNPLFPIPSLMNHGIIFSDINSFSFVADWDLSKQSTRNEVNQDIKAYFALGLGLQELYVHNTLVRPTVNGASWWWDTLAANAKWGRANEMLLNDVHWIGGDAANGAVYGTAAWTSAGGASKGMMMLRNPSTASQTIQVNPQQVLQLPSGVAGTYVFTERDGTRAAFTASAAAPVTITLAPFEVAVFEAVPTDGTGPTPTPTPTVTPSPSVSPSPSPSSSGGVISKAGWSVVSADSQETTSENGAASRAIDGNSTTIWHTKYSGGSVAPLPHEIVIDMGASYAVSGLRYLPRQDGGVNGRIGRYEVYVSPSTTSWGTAVATGTFADTAAEKSVSFAAKSGRYLRIRALSEAGNRGQWTSAAEFTALGQPG
ncbi:MAG: discoidin domain-containing protein [Kineosporiaceae bacterium]